MAVKSDYLSGTLNLTNGSINFTGTGTGWLSAGFKEGDTIIDITGAPQYMGVIASITGQGAGTLTKAWQGPTLSGVSYRMRYQPDGSRATAEARNLIEILSSSTLTSIASLDGIGGNKGIMLSGAGVADTYPLTAFARTFLDDANAGAVQSTLGLTAGLLGASAPVPSAAGNGMADGDFNTLTAYGVYTIAGSWANGPLGTATHTGVCIVLRRSFNQVLQVVYLTNGQVWSRGNNSGAWGRSVDTSWFDPTNIPNSQLANIATARIKGRVSSGTGAVEDLTQAQVRTFLGLSSFMNGVLNSASGDALFTSMGKAQSTGANGYLTLPGGVMIQWGTQAGGASSGTTAFPTAFPTLCASVVPGMVVNSEYVFAAQIVSKTTTGFNYRKTYSYASGVGAAVGEAFHWIAIGY